MATQNRSLKKATKNRGRPFWASSEERVNCEAAPSVDLPWTRLHSPWTYPCSGWVGDCEVRSMQISVSAKISEIRGELAAGPCD